MGLTEASAFKDGSIINDDVKSDAAIAGTKITPNFGSQNITTTGNVSAGQHLALTGTVPHINFNDSDNNPDYRIVNRNGSFNIEDISSNILFSTTTSQASITQNLDCSAGVDVTGNITVTGTVDARDIAADGTKLDNLNKPLVNINLSASQTLSGNNTHTLIQFNTEISDANNCFDTSTHKFTPNVAGFYFVSLTAFLGQDSGTGDIHDTEISVCKNTADSDISDVDGNDTVIARAKTNPTNTNPDQNSSNSLSTIVQMNGSSDFLIFRAKINSGSGVTRKVLGSSTNPSTFFIAYRLQA